MTGQASAGAAADNGGETDALGKLGSKQLLEYIQVRCCVLFCRGFIHTHSHLLASTTNYPVWVESLG